MQKLIKQIGESNNLIICNSTLEECDQLQKIAHSWVKHGFTKISGIYGDQVYSRDTFAIIGLEKSIG